MDTAREFRYRISRAGWTMLALLLGAVVLLWTRVMLISAALPDSDMIAGVLSIMLVVGGILVPVPALELIWWARGRVEVGAGGLSWRGWGRWNERPWGEILAVGMPSPNSGRMDDERIHVVTEEDYEFIHGFGLRERETLREMIRSYGDLAEVEVIGKHTFLCRPGAADAVKERARGQVDPADDDAIDFWAGRFRRF